MRAYWFTLQQRADRSVTPRAARAGRSDASDRRRAAGAADGRRLEERARSATRDACSSGRRCVPFLQRQRWFAAKAREIRRGPLHRLGDAARRRRARRSDDRRRSTTPTAGAETLPRAAGARDGDGARARPETPPAASSRASPARARASIVDGLLDDDVCERLLALIAAGERDMRGESTARCAARAVPRSRAARSNARWMRGSAATRATAWCSSTIAYVLKLFRRIEPGAEPGVRDRAVPDRTRVRPHARRSRAPSSTSAPELEPATLAVVQAAVSTPGIRLGFHASTNCGATTSASPRGSQPDRPRRAPAPTAAGRWHRLEPAAVLRGARALVPGDGRDARASDRGTAPGARRRRPTRRSRPSRSIAAALGALATGACGRTARRRRRCSRQRSARRRERRGRSADAVLAQRARCCCVSSSCDRAVATPACASGFTATTTSARCCAPRRTSSSSISRASRRGRSPSGARSSRR